MKKILTKTNGTSATLIDSQVKALAKNHHIFNLAAGDPLVYPNPTITNAVLNFRVDGIGNCHQYSPTQGYESLRQKIAEPERVLITNGAKQAIYMALMATCDPGDEVILVTPCWSSYFEICHMLHLNIRTATTVDQIERAVSEKTAVILFNNPNNPSGKLYNADFVGRLHQAAIKNDCWIIADEIYSDIIYEGHMVSLKDCRNVIYINGWSKGYALTGWRFGYVIAEPELIAEMTRIQSQMSGPPNSLIQAIVSQVWDEKPLMDMEYLVENRKNLIEVSGLFAEHKPDAGFYFYLPVTEDPVQLCNRFLNEYSIAMTPGDEYGVKNTIRISFANIYPQDIRLIAPKLATIN